jgi:hypothetical protein
MPSLVTVVDRHHHPMIDDHPGFAPVIPKR